MKLISNNFPEKDSLVLYYDPQKISQEARVLIQTLAEEYPIYPDSRKVNLELIHSANCRHLSVHCSKEGIRIIEYGNLHLLSRGIALALAGLESREYLPFSTLGVLWDCTRGNVITLPAFKKWLKKIAMMGYNRVMIYVKDAYQLADEPYFGYMRGAYSMEEIREMDLAAQKLGIELSAAIQVLGHLEPIMRYPVYQNIRDTYSAIMVDEPESYHLIGKMLDFWSNALSSRNIHLGMDETHDLGRGRFMDRNGYEKPLEIFSRHLEKVSEMCRERNLNPMIWSDMYFRYANRAQDYYDTESELSVSKIPDNVRLSYWDYYHKDPEIYEKMLLRTASLNGKMPLMASGIWTWLRIWTDFEMTFSTVRPCLEACKKLNIEELIFTMWGDDGAYCDFDSAFAALQWAADRIYREKEDETFTSVLFECTFKSSWRLQKQCGDLCFHRNSGNIPVNFSAESILWDDPLLGISCNEFPAFGENFEDELLRQYQTILSAAAPYREDRNVGSIDYAWNIANVLCRKLAIRKKLLAAYAGKNLPELKKLCSNDIPGILSAIEKLSGSFRTQWLRNFKHFGLEINQIRFAGQLERFRELQRVLESFISGEISDIPELEIHHNPAGLTGFHYHHIATGNFFI